MRQNLNNHVKNIHGEISQYSYSCDKCDFKTTMKSKMESHSVEKHGIHPIISYLNTEDDSELKNQKEKKFSCHICPSVFTFSSGLSNHIKSVHGQIEWEKVKKKNEDGNLICHVCQSRFRYSSGWSTHIKTQHGLQARMNILKKETAVPYVIIRLSLTWM